MCVWWWFLVGIKGNSVENMWNLSCFLSENQRRLLLENGLLQARGIAQWLIFNKIVQKLWDYTNFLVTATFGSGKNRVITKFGKTYKQSSLVFGKNTVNCCSSGLYNVPKPKNYRFVLIWKNMKLLNHFWLNLSHLVKILFCFWHFKTQNKVSGQNLAFSSIVARGCSRCV